MAHQKRNCDQNQHCLLSPPNIYSSLQYTRWTDRHKDRIWHLSIHEDNAKHRYHLWKSKDQTRQPSFESCWFRVFVALLGSFEDCLLLEILIVCLLTWYAEKRCPPHDAPDPSQQEDKSCYELQKSHPGIGSEHWEFAGSFRSHLCAAKHSGSRQKRPCAESQNIFVEYVFTKLTNFPRIPSSFGNCGSLWVNCVFWITWGVSKIFVDGEGQFQKSCSSFSTFEKKKLLKFVLWNNSRNNIYHGTEAFFFFLRQAQEVVVGRNQGFLHVFFLLRSLAIVFLCL